MNQRFLKLVVLIFSGLTFTLPGMAQVPVPTPPSGVTYSYPNPFDLSRTKQVTITFPVDTSITISVVNIAGETVATIPDAQINAAQGYALWDGEDDKRGFVASGLYFYIVRGASIKMIGKMTILN